MGADPAELKGTGRVITEPQGLYTRDHHLQKSRAGQDLGVGGQALEPLRAPNAGFLTAGAILALGALSLCWAPPPPPTTSSLHKFNFIHLTLEKWKRKKKLPNVGQLGTVCPVRF